MKNVFFILCCSLLFIACERNAITGRNQLNLVQESDLQTMALVQYQTFLANNKVVSSTNSDAEMVKRVGLRIASSVKQYYKNMGLPNALNKYKWEFNLVDSKEVNAWCMPGGKVVIYTGLLAVTQNETALAIVMGHEITHAVVGHGSERMSQEMAAQGIGAIGGIALGGDAKSASIFNNVYGIGAQYGVLLPNSRKQELEADRFGLIFSASAGYNPQAAIDFWTRMASLANGQKPPAFLSSHPSDEERIQRIKEIMPEALQYYKAK